MHTQLCLRKGLNIILIKALRDTGEISELVHKEQALIDEAIYESEQEAAGSAEALEAKAVFEELEKKYFG